MYRARTYRFVTSIICYLLIQQTHLHVYGGRPSKQLFTTCIESDPDNNIYDYSSYDIEDDKKENLVSLSNYRGKTLLIVITATYCVYTQQYPYFNQLKDKYPSENFQILAFPCHQFGLQEPGVTGAEILNGIRFVRPGNDYRPNFPMFEKSDVNGHSERPLFTYLKSRCPSPIEEFRPWPNITYTPMHSNDIRWNFEKFLIDGNGRPVKRFASDVTPAQLQVHIDELLAIPTSKHRHARITSLSRRLHQFLADENYF